MPRLTRTLPAALALAGGVALIAVPAAQAATPRCDVGRLSPSLGATDAGAGNVGQVIILRNHSGRACTLRGYPGMAFLSSSGRILRGTVVRGSTSVFRDPGPRTITLAPGRTASYSLGYVLPQSRACPVTAEVEVTPPNAVDQLLLRARVPVCAGQPMTVSAVVAGSRGAP